MSHTLVITNDFPPRPGGIQTFVYELVSRFDPSKVTVLTSKWDGWEEFDATLPFRVVRADIKVLLPTQSTLKLARQLIAETGASSVLFGAAAPLGMLTPALRKLGVKQVVAITHGHEAGWAITPITKGLLRRIGNSVDTLTYLGGYTKSAIAKVLSENAAKSMRQLTPGVDPEVFHPRNKTRGNELRAQLGLEGRPVVICVSRLMERKGQDSLINALPKIQEAIPNAALVIVGAGSYRSKLDKLAQASIASDDIFFTGKVAYEELPAWYAAGDVFAMPCRTRNAGWDVEGLGIVYLEASATGLPVIAGNSGGAPDAVKSGETGLVVDGTDSSQLVEAVVRLLSDPELAAQFGQAGREWVLDNWTWEREFNRVHQLLAGDDPDA